MESITECIGKTDTPQHFFDPSTLLVRPNAWYVPLMAAEVGVVHLHPALKPSGGLALGHDLNELVLDQPDRAVAHPEMTTQLQGRDIVLGLGEQVHGQKPHRQGQLAGSKDSATEQAGLATARAALPVLADRRQNRVTSIHKQTSLTA